jgi:hypothetical protein
MVEWSAHGIELMPSYLKARLSAKWAVRARVIFCQLEIYLY